eukprot:TRINITY_DN7112_c0_g1_i1.p1 TRINITY_DN7112_c0_g1~~TRINITY_DN7112_c0_g1_i1.p1  ORF type:complete len:260 (+),score=6.08 TRINITY_DN7112_c0_g1_i1:24-803(+)
MGRDTLKEDLLLPVEDGNGVEKPKIIVRELSRRLADGTEVLKKVSVDIHAGSIVGVIGPSGSGKSTFLRALNRLWDPPSGTVFLDGRDITDLNVLSLRCRVGMLFQTPALFDGTIAENVRYGPDLHGKFLSDDQVYQYLVMADLEPSMAFRSIQGLSVGQAQRVALARTLANEPEVLLLDEPTSALDPMSTDHIENSIVKLRESKGLTIVMVSHSIKQMQRIADVVCLLVEGQMVEVLRAADLTQAVHPLARQFLELSA